MRDISIVTKKSTGLAKKSPQRIFFVICPKRTPQPNWAQLRRKWRLTPDSVGVLYTGFQKKRTQRRSSGIAAKNWISEKKPETCELVSRNANIFTSANVIGALSSFSKTNLRTPHSNRRNYRKTANH